LAALLSRNKGEEEAGWRKGIDLTSGPGRSATGKRGEGVAGPRGRLGPLAACRWLLLRLGQERRKGWLGWWAERERGGVEGFGFFSKTFFKL
jgi:hypothetical protein